MSIKTNRRDLFPIGLAALALAMVPLLSRADPRVSRSDEGSVGEIYKLQADFHRAKTMQDLGLMMSLWAEDATLNVQGDAHAPYVGPGSLKAFWQKSGSFTNHRFSLVPSFKTQIEVHGDQAWLYFECHDIGEFDQPSRAFAADVFLAGMVHRVGGHWVFWKMTAGKSVPLSADHFYFSKEEAGFRG
jgi:hypothetical protein